MKWTSDHRTNLDEWVVCNFGWRTQAQSTQSTSGVIDAPAHDQKARRRWEKEAPAAQQCPREQLHSERDPP
jgi:hypothetical protein